MKKIITILVVVLMSSVLIGSETREQKFNRQIAVFESKVFALETENKKLKKELEKKDKAVIALAMRLAGQPVKATSRTVTARRSYSNSSAYNPAQAAKIAAEQQKKQRARQFSIIKKKISYYEKQKTKFEKDYKVASKKVRSAKYILGKSKREDAVQEASDEQHTIKYKIKQLEYNLDSLRKQAFNYQ